MTLKLQNNIKSELILLDHSGKLWLSLY